jgi:ABC-type glutathione transport system ATPase component
VSDQTLLSVQNLVVEYASHRFRQPPTRIIHDVSFSLGRGETLGIVGESGSGKTTIGKAILGLTPVTSGRIVLDGQDITHQHGKERRALAASIQVVFQNPYGSLNPSLTIGRTLAEPLLVAGLRKTEVRLRINELLVRVGLPEDSAGRYPAQFSGGQRQRIAIARAVARQPKIIVCDEPTSSLDVTTQAAALALLSELQETLGCAYLFITHDLAVVREFADRTIVLQSGRIVEEGPSRQVCDSPREAYTQRLVAAAPVPDPRLQRIRRERRLAAAAADFE